MTRFFSLAIILLLALFLFFGFLPRYRQSEKNERIAHKDQIPEVSIQICKPEDKPRALVLPSVTKAYHATSIYARADGYVEKYFVDIGDKVLKGQLLAQLETPELDAEYNQALYQYESAKVRCTLAKVNADRAARMLQSSPGSISVLDHDQFITNFEAAQEDVRAAEANMSRYKDLMQFKQILAPFDGIITQRTIDLGSLVSQANGALFTLADTDVIRIFVNVPQTFFRTIKEGVEGIIKIREFLHTNYKAHVVRYAKALDQIAHTMTCELHIDNKNGELTSGLFAEVTFQLKPEGPYFIVPTSALIIREGAPKVAILDMNNTVHIKTVQIGLDFGKDMEIINGIEPNDRLITNPTEKIKEGVTCKVFSR